MIWSLVSNCGGGGRRLSLMGSKPGVLGSDGSCDDDFNGLVCSDPPSEPGKMFEPEIYVGSNVSLVRKALVCLNT